MGKLGFKDNKMIFIALIAYLVALFYDHNIFLQALRMTGMYLKQMIEILPAVLVVTGLIEVWVSRETILNNFGSEAGLKGKFASVFIGSISAGPIYAAFPVTKTLLKKGASIANVVVILSAWAVVKIPMLIVETKFLGIRFMGARYLLTVPGIIIIGLITEKLVNRESLLSSARELENELESKIMKILPGYNCGSCGYGGCAACAKAIANGEAEVDVCEPGGEEIKQKISDLLNEKNHKKAIVLET